MKKLLLMMVLLTGVLSMNNVKAQYDVKPFEHLQISVNFGSPGLGVQLATPLNRFFSLRAGFATVPFTYDYDYDGYATGLGSYTVPLKAKFETLNGMVLVDFFPFRNKRIHLTGGAYFGGSDILKVTGHVDKIYESVEIGDFLVQPDTNGNVGGVFRVNSFKPYVGLGFGSSVTKKRVGFKFELGAMFQGSPKVVITQGQIKDQVSKDDLDDFNEFLTNLNVAPVVNFQLSFRAF